MYFISYPKENERNAAGQLARTGGSGGQMVRAVKVFMIAWVVPDTQIKEEKKQEERVLLTRNGCKLDLGPPSLTAHKERRA